MSKTKQAPGQGRKYIKKSQMKRIQKVSPSRKVQHKIRLKRALSIKLTNCEKVSPPQNGTKFYEKEHYKPEVSSPIAIGDGVLVLWDDQSEGVCHYMPRSDLKVLGRCNKFYPGTRIAYCHDGTEWTGRIPKSVNEVIECCCMQDAAVDLKTHPKRQVLVLWDNPSAGLCHYMYTKDLRIIDDSYRIYRGTRVAIRWKNYELTGQIPPEIYDRNDFPALSQHPASDSVKEKKTQPEDDVAPDSKPEEYHIKLIDGFWDRVDQFCRDIAHDDIKFFEDRIEQYRSMKPISISALTYNSPKSKCDSESDDATLDKKTRAPDTVASAPVSRRSSVHFSDSGRTPDEGVCQNDTEVDVAALAAAVNRHAVGGAGDGVREMDTDLPSESSTSVEDAGLDVCVKGPLLVPHPVVLEAPGDPVVRLRRRGSTASDEVVMKSRAAASFDRRRRVATMSDRRLMTSKAVFHKRLNSARNQLKIECVKDEPTSPESITDRLKETKCGELASTAAAIVARYERRFPFCPWNELAESMLSDDEEDGGDASEDEVMDAIMQKQSELRIVQDRNRTTFELLVERMKESMERQEILKRVALADEKVTCVSSNIVKLLKLKYRSKGRSRRKFVKVREEAWMALTEREAVMKELETFDLAHGTQFIFKNN